jgi:hypothetical protein
MTGDAVQAAASRAGIIDFFGSDPHPAARLRLEHTQPMAPGHLSGGDPRYVFQRVQDLLPGLPAPVDGNHRANDVLLLVDEEQERHDEELSRAGHAGRSRFCWPLQSSGQRRQAAICYPLNVKGVTLAINEVHGQLTKDRGIRYEPGGQWSAGLLPVLGAAHPALGLSDSRTRCGPVSSGLGRRAGRAG